MSITSAQLLALKPGTLLTVTLRSGRTLQVTLYAHPTLTTSGKPGPNRVLLSVLDHVQVYGGPVHVARLPRTKPAGLFSVAKGFYEVDGAHVLEVVGVAPGAPQG